MNEKKKYYLALKNNRQKLDEISLGESLGLDEDSTMKIISILLSEYKIAYVPGNKCNYRIYKR